jgi:hypothetical protein
MKGMGRAHRSNVGFALLLALLVGVLGSLPLAAQVDQDTLNKLLQRIDQLEKQVNDLKQQAEEAKATQAKQPAAPPANQFYASAKSRLEFYGYAKLDMSYDTGRINPGNYALFIDPMPLNNNNNSQYNMTANQTRLGMNFTAMDSGDAKITGKVEFDFYGNGTANNKAAPLLRQAYMQVYWPKYDFLILAGQTADIISPLTEPTINYTVGWDAGNIGYRRPQLRFDKGWKLGDKSRFDWQVGFSWNAGHAYTNVSGTYNSGVTSYTPTVQTRLGFTFPGAGDQNANLGVSYHYGRETFLPGLPHEPSVRLSSYSYNFDASVPLSKTWKLQGEYFYGADLDQYFGGSNQAYSLTDARGTVASGGWAAVTCQATPKLVFNFGGGSNSPQIDQLEKGARGNVTSYFANTWYTFAKQAQVGFEVSRWTTGYVEKDTVKAMRYQLSFMYTF